ncbi:hypothetical protein MGH68_07565 [Erysipelothrix sp. D19-032]
MIGLAKKAALHIPELGMVGWDVALTKDGPMLIEGNQFPVTIYISHRIPR